MNSVRAVAFGIILALLLSLLMVFFIAAPVFTLLFGMALTSTALPKFVMVFAAALAFYWGGMLAAYRAPNRRRLHGVLVGVTSFAISPLVNLVASLLTPSADDPFANLRTFDTLLLTAVLFVVILVASYVGARRGEVLYAHNKEVIRRQRSRKARERLSEGEDHQREELKRPERRG